MNSNRLTGATEGQTVVRNDTSRIFELLSLDRKSSTVFEKSEAMLDYIRVLLPIIATGDALSDELVHRIILLSWNGHPVFMLIKSKLNGVLGF